jgi:hypothetical protein
VVDLGGPAAVALAGAHAELAGPAPVAVQDHPDVAGQPAAAAQVGRQAPFVEAVERSEGPMVEMLPAVTMGYRPSGTVDTKMRPNRRRVVPAATLGARMDNREDGVAETTEQEGTWTCERCGAVRPASWTCSCGGDGRGSGRPEGGIRS